MDGTDAADDGILDETEFPEGEIALIELAIREPLS